MNLQAVVPESCPVAPEGTATIPLPPSIVKLVRHLPDGLLAEYLQALGVETAVWLEAGGSGRSRVRRIVDGLGLLSDPVLGALGAEAERFVEMTDELGQEALQTAVLDRQGFAAQESALARAVWLHLREPGSFRRAEEIRHTDHYRLGRMWDGFVGPKDCVVSDLPEHRREFMERIMTWFRSPQVKVEVYERVRSSLEEGESRLVQVVVYREGLPDSVLEFENGDLTRRHRRPVYEFALTYEAESGVLEVIAQDRGSREEMARAFAETLLRRDLAGKRIPLREYDLRPLLTIQPFPTDPEDGIAAVEVASLTLQPLIDGAERITFEADRKTGRSLYERIFEWFREHNPLTAGFRIQRATLSVRFHPDEGVGRGKVVAVRLSLPNGCNLKSKTEKERLVCEKYLPRWGLVREV
ncbi:MAG: hypothetical protein H7831_03245 [Magnetococcus sp. WYHC-3]